MLINKLLSGTSGEIRVPSYERCTTLRSQRLVLWRGWNISVFEAFRKRLRPSYIYRTFLELVDDLQQFTKICNILVTRAVLCVPAVIAVVNTFWIFSILELIFLKRENSSAKQSEALKSLAKVAPIGSSVSAPRNSVHHYSNLVAESKLEQCLQGKLKLLTVLQSCSLFSVNQFKYGKNSESIHNCYNSRDAEYGTSYQNVANFGKLL